jgi:integrase
MRTAPETFTRKGDAERYLTLVEAQLARNEWTDPAKAQIRLAEYAVRWIDHRARLRPRTVELYRWLLGRYVVPHLGKVPLGRLDPAMIREWRAQLLEAGVSETMAAKAYRLVRAVLMTAVNEDEILAKNPCRVPGADQEKPAERPVLSVAQVLALADRVPVRHRALVLVATFGCLRWGEVSALQRSDVDIEAGTVRVRQAFTEQRGAGLVLGPPKSRAGRRVVSLPGFLLPQVQSHLDAFVGKRPDAFVFTGPTGAPMAWEPEQVAALERDRGVGRFARVALS